MTDIAIRSPEIGGSRVIIEARSTKGTKFLQAHGYNFDSVCFGEGSNSSHYSVHTEQVLWFQAFANARGVVAEWKRKGE